MDAMEPTTAQPQPITSPSRQGIVDRVVRKVSTRHGWLGDYDFAWLCTPSLPFGRKEKGLRRSPPFYALDADLPLLLAIICGFQHALAMLAGLITPPIICESLPSEMFQHSCFTVANALSLPPDYQSYMISASLIASGFLSMIQMSHVRLPFAKSLYLGTGLITCVGTSFATLSTAFSIFSAMYADGTCQMVTLPDGTTTRGACPDAYGALLGTAIVCAPFEMLLSFIPAKTLKRLFPPIVTGTVVVLIGASLIGESGFLNWGGGSNDCHTRPATGFFHLCPNIAAPRPLPFGSPEFLGLGFLSFITIILIEIFGSPFLRNASLICGIVVGMIVAGPAGYIDGSSISSAPAITFLWVRTFKLRIYGPAVLPMLSVYLTLALEAIGDTTASAEASRQEVEGQQFDERIQGGVLADGLAGLLSGLATVTPMSIFAQNNGVIVLTRCANRQAGYICACWLILFGILGKLSGIFLAIPNSVLGGVTSFLFASVVTSGIRVLCKLSWDRRDRFVLASALTFGFGNLLVPNWATHLFEGVQGANAALSGFLNSIVILLSTPYLIAGLTAIILNLILPHDAPDGGNNDVSDEPTHDLEHAGVGPKESDDYEEGK